MAAGAAFAGGGVGSNGNGNANTNADNSLSVNNRIVVVGLNGALQKRFVLPDRQVLVPGNVHRAAGVDFGVGGKGQDVAIALHCLLTEGDRIVGEEHGSSNNSDAIRLVQFLGTGFAGDTVYGMLEDRLGGNAMGLTVRSATELRTCTSIVAADETTELVEPSGRIAAGELGDLLARLPPPGASAGGGRARALCVMGSMPPGCPGGTYAEIYERVAGPETVCVVDSLAGIDPVLRTAGGLGPLVLKLNASELCKLGGTPKAGSETGGVTPRELVGAAEGFCSLHREALRRRTGNASACGVVGLAITDGKHDAYFVGMAENTSDGGGDDDDDDGNGNTGDEDFTILRFPVPSLDTSRTLYPIGAGDAVAAGMVGAWADLAAIDAASATSSILSKESLGLLEGMVQVLQRDDCPSLSRIQVHAAVSFAFGLACGSASCLREENSVLDAGDANRLLRSMLRHPPKVVRVSGGLRRGVS